MASTQVLPTYANYLIEPPIPLPPNPIRTDGTKQYQGVESLRDIVPPMPSIVAQSVPNREKTEYYALYAFGFVALVLLIALV